MSETNGHTEIITDPNGYRRGPGGLFADGTKGGPGNPGAGRVAELRHALLDAVSVDDLKAIVAKLVDLAKGGCLDAAGLLFDRVFGRAPQALAVKAEIDAGEPPLNSHSHEERRRRLAEIAARLQSECGPGDTVILQREDFYGNDAHERESA